MFRKIIFGLFFVVGAVALPARADAAAIRCDTCMNSTDFRNAAIARGVGTHIVFNVTNNTIEQYNVAYNTGGGAGGGVRPMAVGPSVRQQAPPAAAVQEVATGHRIYIEGGGSLRPIYVVPSSQLGLPSSMSGKTAFDYVLDRNLQAMIESSAGSPDTLTRVINLGFLGAVTDLVQMASNFTGLRDMARVMMKIVFSDGSSVMVVVDLQHVNGVTETNSARTASGQLIPEDIQNVQGEWNSNPGENLNRMAEHMAALGATISTVGSGGGFIRGISCSGAGATKICSVQYMAQ